MSDTTRATLIEALQHAGLKVDPTSTTRTYVDGVVYVLLDPTARHEPRSYTVVAAVKVGQDIETFSDRTQAAIAAAPEHFTALSTDYSYADTPVPGRDMPQADLARITVISDRLY